MIIGSGVLFSFIISKNVELNQCKCWLQICMCIVLIIACILILCDCLTCLVFSCDVLVYFLKFDVIYVYEVHNQIYRMLQVTQYDILSYPHLLSPFSGSKCFDSVSFPVNATLLPQDLLTGRKSRMQPVQRDSDE